MFDTGARLHVFGLPQSHASTHLGGLLDQVVSISSGDADTALGLVGCHGDGPRLGSRFVRGEVEDGRQLLFSPVTACSPPVAR